MEFEFCIESASAAAAAEKYHIDRVELCSDLANDGLSPGRDLFESCRSVYSGEIYMMVRPAAGGFYYSESVIQQMRKEILTAAELGASGVVFGILNEHLEIDVVLNRRLIELAHSFELGVTFHRAFDVCKKPLNALEQLIEIGFDRILTSGQKPTAEEGIELIRDLVQLSSGKIEIMAGSGVCPANAGLLAAAGVDALHFSVHRKDVQMTDTKYINKNKIEGILSRA